MAAPTLQLPATFTSTHQTDGLAGYPAIDEFAAPGTPVLSPASGKLTNVHFIPWDAAKKVGGWTGYLVSSTGTYFLTHLGTILPAANYAQGQQIGTVAAVPGNAWAPHIHEGFDAGNTTGPGSASSGGGGIMSTITKSVEGAVIGTAFPPAAFLDPSKVLGGAKDIVTAPLKVADFLGKLTDLNFLLRVGQVIGGAILAFAGLILLAKQIGLATPSVPGPSQAVAAAVA